MQEPLSIVPALFVASIPAALPCWEALGFRLVHAFAGDGLLETDAPEELEAATFARLDGATARPVSVFLDTVDGARAARLHLMLPAPADVDEVAARLAAAGHALEEPPTDRPWGMRDLRVIDRDGHLLIVGAALDA